MDKEEAAYVSNVVIMYKRINIIINYIIINNGTILTILMGTIGCLGKKS